jgi:hypothetical protein
MDLWGVLDADVDGNDDCAVRVVVVVVVVASGWWRPFP